VNLGLVNLGLVNLGLVNLGLVNLGLVNLRLVILTCPFNPFQCPGDGQRGWTASGLVGRAQADGKHPRLLHLGPRRSHRARNGRRIKFSLQRFVEKVDLCSFPDLNVIENKSLMLKSKSKKFITLPKNVRLFFQSEIC
jgi:hypothetical protein